MSDQRKKINAVIAIKYSLIVVTLTSSCASTQLLRRKSCHFTSSQSKSLKKKNGQMFRKPASVVPNHRDSSSSLSSL